MGELKRLRLLGGWRLEFDDRDCPQGLLHGIEGMLLKGVMPEGCCPLDSSVNTRVWKFPVGGFDYVFKEFLSRDSFEVFKSVLRGSRAERAWKGGRVLLENGFLTPPTVAWGVKSDWGLPTRNFFVSRFLPQTCGMYEALWKCFEELSPERGLEVRRNLMGRLGSTVGRLHSAGIIHGDLRPDNVLVKGYDESAPGSSLPEFYFIDNERNEIFEGTPPRELLVKNLIQLNMVWLKMLSRTERARFFRAYVRAFPGVGLRKKGLAREVWQVTMKRMEKYGGIEGRPCKSMEEVYAGGLE